MSLSDLIARMAAQNAAALSTEPVAKSAAAERPVVQAQSPATQVAPHTISQPILLNEQQQLAVSYASGGKSFALIGPAGSGKTTTLAQSAIAMLRSHKPEEIAMVAFTNTAANNIKRAMMKYPELEEFANKRCCTIHRLLGFRPVPYSYTDDKGNAVDSMRFEPLFDKFNKLNNIKLVIVEEASMLGLDLWKQLFEALPEDTCFVFVGDINQIPPVFGDSILGFKLLELPVVELTQIYRQALESPIVGFQHRYTLPGVVPGDSFLTSKDGLVFLPTRGFIRDPDEMCASTAKYFKDQFLAGSYNPEEDMILIPYNKKFGTIGLNARIAQWVGEDRGAVVHEIIAGFEKHYYAIGDRVRYKKEEYVISDITRNHSYTGVSTQEASPLLTRLGTYKSAKNAETAIEAPTENDWDFNELLMQVDSMDEETGAKNATSHLITIRATTTWGDEPPVTHTITNRGELNDMDFGYAMTIHKSQGSEWRKVYLIMTKHHAPMLSRELLYTGMTRAREELVVMYSPQSRPGAKDSSVAKCVNNPRIPGQGWAQKQKYFREKVDEYLAHMKDGNDGLSKEDRKLLAEAEECLI